MDDYSSPRHEDDELLVSSALATSRAVLALQREKEEEQRNAHSDLALRFDESLQMRRRLLEMLEEQKHTEETIREQQRYLDSLVSNLPGMVYRCQNDPAWTMTYASEGCLALTGYTRSELEHNRLVAFSSLVHADDQAWLRHKRQVSLAEKSLCNNEYRIVNKAGETRWVWERANGLYAADDHLLCIEGFVTDITSRKEAEMQRHLLLERYNSIFTSVAVGLMLHQANGDIVECNPTGEKILGLKRSDIIGRNALDPQWRFVGTNGRPLSAAEQPAMVTLRTGRAVRGIELRLHRRDDTLVTLQVNAEPVHDATLRVTHVVVSFVDITQQRRAEEARNKADTRLQAAVVASRLVWWEWHLQTGVFHVNACGAQCILGYSEQQLAGLTSNDWIQRVHPSDRPEVVSSLQEMLSGRIEHWICDHRMQAGDGSWQWVRNMGRIIERGPDGAPTLMAGTTQDVHAHHLAEQSSTRTARRLQIALAASQMGTWSINLQTLESESDDRTDQIFQLGPGGLPKNQGDLLALIHPEDRPAFAATCDAIRAGLKSFEFTCKIIRPSGEIRSVRVVGTVQWDAQGNAESVTGITEDITHRIQAEDTQRKLQMQLVESQKLETIGTLAGGVAHDFNNLLTSILGFVDLALTSVPPQHPVSEMLVHARNGGLRARDLVKRLLLFARRGPEAARQPVDLAKIAAETAKLLTATLPASVKLQAELGDSVPAVLADPGQIQQVLMNLCVNAAHAIGAKQGQITLSARLTQVRAGDGVSCSPGEYVCLTVADNGSGMDEATIPKIFDPFFTTKPQGEGTGLGLSIVHGVVHQHGGTLSVHSALGLGSRFDIYLPVARQQVSTTAIAPLPGATLQGARRKVLIAEDEGPIRQVIAHVLKNAGFEIELCEDGQAASERFSAAPESFALVVTDLSMPRRNGLELIRDVQARRQNVPIILMSGDVHRYGGDDVVQGRHLLQLAKPFLPDELLAVVRKLVESPEANSGL